MRLYLTIAVLALALCAVAEAQQYNPYDDDDNYRPSRPASYGNKYEVDERYKNENSEDLTAEKSRKSGSTDRSLDRGIDIDSKNGIRLKNLQKDIEKSKSKESRASSNKKGSTDLRRKYDSRRHKSGYKKDDYEPKQYEEEDRYGPNRYEKNRYERKQYPKKPSYKPTYEEDRDEYRPTYKKEYKPTEYKPTYDRYAEPRYEAKVEEYKPKKSYTKPKSAKPYYQPKAYGKPKYEDTYKLSASAYPQAQKYDDEGVLIDNNNNNINKNVEEATSGNKIASANANEQRVDKKNEKLNYKENNGGSYRRRN